MKSTFRERLRTRLGSLGARLCASHMLVTFVGTATFLVAVSIIAPTIFGRLVDGMAGPGQMMTMDEMMGDVTRAFMRTLLYSLLTAALAAGVTATLASLFVARRISGPLRRMAGATRRIASGRYGERVPVTSTDELGNLADSFNVLAKTLQDTEQRRLDLISDVSHELRTPLSTIEGYMEGLIDGVIEPSDETWALVHGEAERLKRLVEDLQELSRAEAGRLTLKPEPVNPAEAIRLTAERLEPLYDEKGVSLEIAVLGDLAPVLADPHRVAQILTNLLSNALRHTPTGGRATVEAEAGKRGKHVIFRVSDTGEGITSEHLPHIFERFYRAESSRSRKGGGAGVGLAISRALVEAMGGEMEAQSPGPGGGATFYFTLPVASPNPNELDPNLIVP